MRILLFELWSFSFDYGTLSAGLSYSHTKHPLGFKGKPDAVPIFGVTQTAPSD